MLCFNEGGGFGSKGLCEEVGGRAVLLATKLRKVEGCHPTYKSLQRRHN